MLANLAGRLEGVKVTSPGPVEGAFDLPMSLEETHCWYLRSEIFGSDWHRQWPIGMDEAGHIGRPWEANIYQLVKRYFDILNLNLHTGT